MAGKECQQGGTGMASLNTNRIMASFSTVPVAGMASLNTNKIAASMHG